MGIKYQDLLAKDAAPISKVARIAALTIFLSSFAGSAMAFNTYHALIDDPVSQMPDGATNAPITSSPSPSMADSCLPLLKSIRQAPPVSAMDRNQRSAGQAAALGLVFGLRFALAPPKNPRSGNTPKPTAHLDLWQPEGAFAGDRHALAVSSYRRCQKDQALRAMEGFRWAR